MIRCLDPEKKRSNLNLLFSLFSLVILAMAFFQYGPVANDIRKERIAVQQIMDGGSAEPLKQAETERRGDEGELPKSSATLLICGIYMDFSIILWIER